MRSYGTLIEGVQIAVRLMVMAVGTRLGPFAKALNTMSTSARAGGFIQIDVNHRVLGLTQDVGPDLGGLRMRSARPEQLRNNLSGSAVSQRASSALCR
jgi:hypothetical protein